MNKIKKESNKKRSSSLIQKLKSRSTKNKIFYPQEEYEQLNHECQALIHEAETSLDTQFYIGKCLIDGKGNFPQNTAIGINYLENAISKGSIDAVLYYSKMLIEGEIIPRDTLKAKKYLKKYLKQNNASIFLLYGKIKKMSKKYTSALKYFEKASKGGNAQGMYEFGKMLLKGKGTNKNEKKAKKYFEMAKKNGFLKSTK